MSAENELLEKWRELPKDKQQEVIDFVEFLHFKTIDHPLTQKTKTPLGERLRQLRTKIVASGAPLLTQDDIEKEITSRRGGLQEFTE
ncbi:DUF2281 domain-containing protein [Cylindrospermum sp. FACHB-282]|uniref:DUF2281 domain-containing protein n=1 Tax=Cylindrospermum sp. FACHB-282 TaxID=2692794 RepID=UPI001685C289|nr:DUF2281 domain-containing protein [Cylindrospermum sp. FACHB-282]MBD2387896.1 DUF2281 domain-containing protein [Cylindrospermum sp. FACHB-282]